MPFFLEIRQQPVLGRMSGFSRLQDRRNLEPPLILQAKYRNEDGTIHRLGDSLEWLQLVCHVTIWQADGKTPATTVVNSHHTRLRNNIIGQAPTTLINAGEGHSLESQQSSSFMPDMPLPPGAELFESLLGTTIVSGDVFRDLDGIGSLFFTFGDLAIRSRGTYRLRCQLIHPQTDKKVSQVLDQVMTDTFEIFSAKRYPGSAEPTPLSRHLLLRGAKIQIKRELKSATTAAASLSSSSNSSLSPPSKKALSTSMTHTRSPSTRIQDTNLSHGDGEGSPHSVLRDVLVKQHRQQHPH